MPQENPLAEGKVFHGSVLLNPNEQMSSSG